MSKIPASPSSDYASLAARLRASADQRARAGESGPAKGVVPQAKGADQGAQASFSSQALNLAKAEAARAAAPAGPSVKAIAQARLPEARAAAAPPPPPSAAPFASLSERIGQARGQPGASAPAAIRGAGLAQSAAPVKSSAPTPLARTPDPIRAPLPPSPPAPSAPASAPPAPFAPLKEALRASAASAERKLQIEGPPEPKTAAARAYKSSVSQENGPAPKKGGLFDALG